MKKLLASLLALTLVFGSAVSTGGIAVLNDTGITASAEDSENGDLLLRDKISEMNYDEAIEFVDSYNGGIYAEKGAYENGNRFLKCYVYKNLYNENDEIIGEILAKRYNDFLYAEENGRAVILGYIGENTSVNIPESINGLPVKALSTHMGMDYFYEADDRQNLAGIGGGSNDDSFVRRNDISELNIFIPESVERIERTDNGFTVTDSNYFFGNYSQYGDDVYSDVDTDYPIRLTYAENSPIEKYLNENADNINLGENVTYGVGKPFEDESNKPLYDYKYKALEDGTLEITDYTGSDTEVTIPSEINGKKVTSIGSFAFQDCINITNVTIPDSISNIGYDSFAFCWKLETIKIPESVTGIGEYAFYQCNSLTNVVIPGNVKTVGECAFGSCENLSNITISEGVEKIDSWAFDNLKCLTSITIPSSVTSVGEMMCGYYLDEGYQTHKTPDFKVYCYSGTAGEKYAIDNDFAYELLDDTNSNSDTNSETNSSENGGNSQNSSDGNVTASSESSSENSSGKTSNSSSTTKKANNSTATNPNTGAAAGLALAALGLGAVVAAKRRK